MAAKKEEIPTYLPLDQFTEWAASKNRATYESPSRGGVFRSPMWEFVRLMKAHPDLRALSAKDAYAKIASFLCWNRFPHSEDPMMEFLTTWDKIRVPAGDDILVNAFTLAKERQLRVKDSVSPNCLLILTTAFHLQRLRPDDYINLPVERLGKLLNVNPRTISMYLAWAKKHGYLSQRTKGHAFSHQAARYKFRQDYFDPATLEERNAGSDSPFHKDSKEFKDSEDLKESDDPRRNLKRNEEPERQGGFPGGLRDFERKVQNLGAGVALNSVGTISPDKRREAERQKAFLLEKDAAKRRKNS